MKYFTAAICLILIMILSYETYGAEVSEVSLYKSLFYNEIPRYSPSRLDISPFPKELQGRIKSYKERANNFHSKLRTPHNSPESEMGFYKIVQIEKGIVSLIDSEGIQDIAANYAKKAKIYLEWEGGSDGPLDEAQFAENYLNQNPETPLKPYLLLFLLNRYRSAFECLDFEKNYKKQAEISEKYRLYLKFARDDKDPLVVLIANDINRQEYLYIKTEKKP